MTQPRDVQEQNLEEIAHLVKNKSYQKFDDLFLELHARDQIRIFEKLSEREREAVYYLLTPEEMADLFDIMEEDSEHLETYFTEMETSYAADLLNAMQVDNAVDVLEQFEEDVQEEFFEHMEDEDVEHFQEMLDYDEHTAGSIMTTEVALLKEDWTAQEAITNIKNMDANAETIYYLYTVDGTHHLTGVVSLRNLLFAEPNTVLRDIMNVNVMSVRADQDQEEVAHMIREYDFLALPVVNANNVLLGLITVDDVMDVLDEEHAEDYSGLAAVDVNERPDTPWAAAKTRLPWLVALLVLGIGTSSLISSFEGIVSAAPILAAFISLTTGTAGNAGTQSLAVAIRRLADYDEDARSASQMLIQTLLTGLLTGIIVGIAALLIVGIWQSNIYLGLVIGIAMVFAVALATLVGTYIPIFIEKIGFDPAVASGPFITTAVDLTSVLIYFSVAQFFMSAIMDL